MKILHVVTNFSPKGGGPPKVIFELTEILAKKGIEISIFAPVKRGEESKIVSPKEVRLQLFQQGFPAKWWRSYSKDLAKALEQEIHKFDLVHIHELWHHPHFAAYRAAKKTKIPYIITIHGCLEPWAFNYKAIKKRIYLTLIQKRILKEALALWAITPEEAENIKKIGINTKVVVIPNGINLKEFQKIPPRQHLEKYYPSLTNKKIVLFLGRIHPIKGLHILARAFAKVAKERDDFKLVIAGPDEIGYQKDLEKILKSEGVLDKTIFTGWVTGEKKLMILGNADVFVLPSRSEVRGVVILEAMACGVPVIATRHCHFPEVEEKGAGILVDSEVEQMAEAILKLADNPNLRKEMGGNGKKLVSERFTWDKIANQALDLYKDVLRSATI